MENETVEFRRHSLAILFSNAQEYNFTYDGETS